MEALNALATIAQMRENKPQRTRRNTKDFVPATFVILCVLCGCLSLSTGCSRNPVTIDHEPSHHLVFSNDYLRVYRVEAGAHQSTKLHRHDHDYIWVSIGPADITNAVQGKPVVKAHLDDGDVHFVAGNFAHVVTNDADKPFRNYTIALLGHGSVQLQPGEDAHSVNLLHSGTVESLFVQDGIRATDITLNPGATVSGPHLARPHLLIHVNPDDGHLEWANQGEGLPLSNPTDHPARYLLLEF